MKMDLSEIIKNGVEQAMRDYELKIGMTVKEAVEKQVPKKPITYKDTNRADCPCCGATVRGIKEPYGDWCSKCGTKIDWSVKE